MCNICKKIKNSGEYEGVTSHEEKNIPMEEMTTNNQTKFHTPIKDITTIYCHHLALNFQHSYQLDDQMRGEILEPIKNKQNKKKNMEKEQKQQSKAAISIKENIIIKEQ